MLTLAAPNDQKFTVTLQMHKIILHLFGEAALCLVKGISYVELVFVDI